MSSRKIIIFWNFFRVQIPCQKFFFLFGTPFAIPRRWGIQPYPSDGGFAAGLAPLGRGVTFVHYIRLYFQRKRNSFAAPRMMHSQSSLLGPVAVSRAICPFFNQA